MAKKINSNSKGKDAEREVSELIRSYGFQARRGQQFSGGNESPDVISNLGTHIEVKRVEAFNLYKAVAQAKEDSGSTNYAIFHRKSRKEWVVIQDANKYLSDKKHNGSERLLKEIEKLTEEVIVLRKIKVQHANLADIITELQDRIDSLEMIAEPKGLVDCESRN